MRLNSFITTQIGNGYKLGSARERCSDLDCLALLKRYLIDCHGIRLPVSYEGITLSNYASWYEKDNKKTLKKLVGFLDYFLVKNNTNKNMLGDIILFSSGDEESIAVGIDCGNGYILTVDKEGGAVITRSSNFVFKGGYKCQQQSH